MKKILLKFPLALPLVFPLALTACNGTSDAPDAGPGPGVDLGPNPPVDMGMLPPVGNCPGDGSQLTVCDLKLPGGANQPALEDPIVLSNVLVTTPTIAVSFNMEGMPTLAAFFVQDQMTNAELNNRYAGIAVVYSIADLQNVPSQGSVIDIEGIYTEFGRDGATPQKQVRATFITNTGNAMVTPTVIDDPGIIASGQGAAQYEGVIVRVNNVVAQTINPTGAGGNSIFGFQTAEGLIISTVFTRYFAQTGEGFNSVTGVLRLGTNNFDSGIYSLSPRAPTDIDSQVEKLMTIKAIQDPNDPGAPAEVCVFDSNGASGNCPRIDLRDVVVTAVGGFISGDLRSIYVMDDSVADGRFAGVKVVYDSTRDVGPVPNVGDRVGLTGELIDFFRSRQIQNVRFTEATEVVQPQPIVVQPADIARTEEPESNAFEGVLVQLQNATVAQACLDVGPGRDFGNWLLTGDVFVGVEFNYAYNGDFPMGVDCNQADCTCAAAIRPNDMRTDMDQFQSVTGVVDYGFGDFRLQPRGDADLVQ